MPPAAPPTAATSGQAQQNLQSFTGGMQTPDQAIANANNQFGVNQQQQTVQGLRTALQGTNNLLNNVAPGVMGRTANSLVTSAQANRQIQNESAPLYSQYNKQSTDYSNANQDYQSALGQAQNAADANLGFQSKQQSYLQGVYNDLYTKETGDAQLAEQKREADMQAAISNKAAAGASPSFGNLSGAGTGAAGSMTRNSVGGYGFTNNLGTPITMGQYVAAQGGGFPDVLHMLSQGSADDKAIASKVQGLINTGKWTAASLSPFLIKDYPQIFGG